MSTTSNIRTPTTTTLPGNLMETANANASFKTFSKAVESAGLRDTLSGPGPFTVLAPTDAAFAKLPAGKLDSLLKPEHKDELVSLLKGHVVNGRKSVADIGSWQAAKTLDGKSSPVVMANGKFSIGGAHVTEGDISSSNGVIHGIDQVILPMASATRQ